MNKMTIFQNGYSRIINDSCSQIAAGHQAENGANRFNVGMMFIHGYEDRCYYFSCKCCTFFSV